MRSAKLQSGVAEGDGNGEYFIFGYRWRTWFDSELKPLRTEARRLVEQLKKEGLHNVQIEQHQVKPACTTGLTLADVEKAVKVLLG